MCIFQERSISFSRRDNKRQTRGLVDLVERHFLWEQGHPIEEPWVGISHMTPGTPEYWNEADVDNLFENENFIKSLEYCRCFIVMSDYLKTHVSEMLKGKVRVECIKHPVSANIRQFNFNVFKNKKEWSVIQLGQQMRYLTTIYRLKTSFKKIWLSGSRDSDKMNRLLKGESNWLDVDINRDEVETPYVKNFHEYDLLITENIILINLINASANNSILEMMASNTPFFVNKLDPVVEYLGEDYPMYYGELSEVEELLEDKDSLLSLYQKTHDYLKGLDKDDVSLKHFNSEMLKVIN